ncbi:MULTISPECIES: YibE/F family protein [unclassified Streptomyces]|uniref:YibE/F family protein n=1 Tax=Streptomyces sp. NPDC007000 TaxID=3155357 RepID=UPI000AE4BFA4|nr:YibE/F family protein [Streptomyces sp. NBRC 110035]
MTSTQPPPYPPPEPPRGSGARIGGDRGREPTPDHGLNHGDGQKDGPGSGDWFGHGHGSGEAPAAQSRLPGRGPGQGQGGQGGQGQGRARGQDRGPDHGHSPDPGGGGRGHGSNSGGGPNPGGGYSGPPPGDGGHQHSPGSDGGHGHGHSHSHGPAAPVSKHLRKVIAAVLIPFGAAVLIGLAVLWPGGAPGHERTGVGFDRQTQQATVTKVDEVSCSSVNASGGVPTGDTSTAEGSSAQQQADGTCKKATIRVDTGDDAGRTFTEIVQPDQSRQLSEGQEVVVAYEPSAPEDLQYSVADVNRRVPLALLAGIFAVAVVAVGRLRGVMALIALAVSFLVLNFFILPAILQGSNPLVVAVVGASAIMLQALYLCHGLSARTSVAVLGTLISLLLIGVLGSAFISWAALTGDTDDNTGLIHGLYPDIDMSGLLLAGVIIGSLGVLDDVTVTQTSAVWELHEANPSMGRRGLYRAGIRIGRDHIASVVNTLVLAYAGAALPLLLLFSIAQSSVGTVANSELVAEEIVRTLIGSIGLVASVPVTTALAALVVSADRPTAQAAEEGVRAAPARGGGRGRRRKR